MNQIRRLRVAILEYSIFLCTMIIDNVELHIRVITEISPGDNFYTVQLFPLIRPRSGIEMLYISCMIVLHL